MFDILILCAHTHTHSILNGFLSGLICAAFGTMLTNNFSNQIFAVLFAFLPIALYSFYSMENYVYFFFMSIEQPRIVTQTKCNDRGAKTKEKKIITMFHMRKCLMTAIFHVYNFNTIPFRALVHTRTITVYVMFLFN